MKGKIFWTDDEGSKWSASTLYYPTLYDITTCVQTLYTAIIDNDEWDFRHLSDAEMLIIGGLAKACEFEGWERVQDRVNTIRHQLERDEFLASLNPGRRHYFGENNDYDICGFPSCRIKRESEQARVDKELYDRYRGAIPHEHVWSSISRCLWPLCEEKESDGIHDNDQV